MRSRPARFKQSELNLHWIAKDARCFHTDIEFKDGSNCADDLDLVGHACQKFSHAAPQMLSSVAVSQFEFGVACNSYINTMLNILMSRCNPAESVREQSIRRQRIP